MPIDPETPRSPADIPVPIASPGPSTEAPQEDTPPPLEIPSNPPQGENDMGQRTN